MRDGGGDGPCAALVVEIAACWRGQVAQVIMMVMVIEGMDGVSTNHSCEMDTNNRAPWFRPCTQSYEIMESMVHL